MKGPTPKDIQMVAADPTLWFCWFSQTSWNLMMEINQFLPLWDIDKRKTSVYRSPEGKEFTITSVTRIPDPMTDQEDRQYLGIGRWARFVRVPTK